MTARLLVFTATYNERSNIDLLLAQVWQAAPQADVLVVDDASPDGTGDHLAALVATEPRLHLIRRPGKLGLGTAHQLGMLFAIQRGYDQLITMDADLSHDPSEIPNLVARLDTADFVIGSRYGHGGSSDYTGYRHFLSVSANTLARNLLGVPTHEFTTSFRAFRVDMLRERRSAQLKGAGYSYFMETVFRLHRSGFRIAEVPIRFHDRHSGESKIPKFEIFRGASKLVQLAASRTLRRRSTPATNVDARCRGCASTFLMEYFPATASGRSGPEAYRCTTLTHHRKPQVALCLQCGLMQVPKAAQPRDLDELYREVEDPIYLENAPAREATFGHLYQQLAPMLGPPGRLLEVGAYCGLFLNVARTHGWVTEGVEPSSWASAVSRDQHGLDVHTGTIAAVRDRLRPPYDALVAWDVLEHLEAPFDLFIDANELLDTGGLFAFSTLDVASWFPRLVGRAWPWWMDMHLYYFTQPLLKRWLDRAGFDTIHIGPYRHYASPSYLARKAVSLLPTPVAAAAAAVPGRLPADLAVPISFGDIVLVVARKRGPTTARRGDAPDSPPVHG